MSIKHLIAPLAALALAAPAGAASFSFSGDFQHDGDVALFKFTINEDSIPVDNGALFAVLTRSFAGGINVADELVPAGGFDPIIWIFDPKTRFFTYSYGSPTGGKPADPATGCDCDAYASFIIDPLSDQRPGTYYVALTQSANYPERLNTAPEQALLRDGFVHEGEDAYTGDLCGVPGAKFYVTSYDICQPRTGHWEVDILGVDSAEQITLAQVPVPELATWTTMLGGFALVGATLRGRRRRLA